MKLLGFLIAMFLSFNMNGQNAFMIEKSGIGVGMSRYNSDDLSGKSFFASFSYRGEFEIGYYMESDSKENSLKMVNSSFALLIPEIKRYVTFGVGIGVGEASILTREINQYREFHTGTYIAVSADINVYIIKNENRFLFLNCSGSKGFLGVFTDLFSDFTTTSSIIYGINYKQNVTDNFALFCGYHFGYVGDGVGVSQINGGLLILL